MSAEQGRRPHLHELLGGYGAAVITEIARLAGVDSKGARKEAMVTRLAHLFAQAPRIKARLAALDPAARMALDHLQRAGGRQTRAALVESLVEFGGATAPRTRQQYKWAAPEWASGSLSPPGSPVFQDVMARLETSGLALGQGPAPGTSVLDLGSAREFVIPFEVWKHLPPPGPLPQLPAPSVSREVPGDAAEFSRRLFFLWRYIARVGPSLLRTDLLSKKDLKAVIGELGLTVDIKTVASEVEVTEIHFDRLLLAALGLTAGYPGGRLTADEAKAAPFWALPLAARVQGCLEAYTDSRRWNELEHLERTPWQPQYTDERSKTPDAVLAARMSIIAWIGGLSQDGAWVSVPDLMRDLKLAFRDFLLTPGPSPRSAYNRGYGYSAPPDHRYSRETNREGWHFQSVRNAAEGWDMVETAFVEQVIALLGRLGLADIGLGGTGRVVTWRLTPLGRHLLAEAEAPEEPAAAGARIVVQPNFQVVAFGPVPVTTLHEIEQFADRGSADRAITYTLTRASLYRGQQNGWDGPRVTARLVELSGAELPQNVARSIAEWQSLHERIVIQSGVRLVQTADPATLDALIDALARTEQATLRSGSPRSQDRDALARPERSVGGAESAVGPLERLAPTLAMAGASPALDRALAGALEALDIHPRSVSDRDPRGTLRVDEDGAVTLVHPVADVATLGWLQKLAAWDADAGRWRVTAAAARAAESRLGISAEDQVQRWALLHAGPLPGSLAVRLKAWTGHYGAARQVTGVVIELPSAQVLAELRAHPEIARALQPVEATGPLVTIAAANYARVAERLRELGLELPDLD